MKIKIEPAKVISIVATVVGVAATLLSNVSQDKAIKEEVAKEVAKVLSQK